MIVSMTGFGHAAFEDARTRAEASVRSLNHRFLEVSVRMPRAMTSLEPALRALVQERVRRGRVDLSLSWERRTPDPGQVRLSPGVVAGLVARAGELRSQGIAGELTVSDVVRFPEAIELAPDEGCDEAAHRQAAEVVRRALDALVAMRRSEGARLQRVLGEHLRSIRSSIDDIEAIARWTYGERVRQLEERLAELVQPQYLADGRAYAEIVKLVEKAEVAEELARLRGHAAAVEEAWGGDEACGKRLDFLAQEMSREGNTIASKSASLAISHAAVVLKSEIERFREQVQNVE